MGVQHGGQTQQKVVNVQVKVDGTKEAKALLSDFGKSVKNAMQGIDYSPYIKDQIKLIEDLKSAMDSFLYMKTKGSSNNVIRIFNALQATGFEDFKKAFEGYDIGSIIDQANQKLKDLNATESITANTTAYSVEAIANLRQGLELLAKVGVNKGEFLNSLMYDADAARKKIEELTKKVADLQFELEFSDKGKLDQLTSDLEKIRTAFKEEFANWLKGVGFDTDIVKKAFDDNFTGTAAGERMRELFREINEESLTASQAISRFGTEYAAVIKEMTGQAPENLFSAETVSTITALEAKFDELTKKLDDLIASAGQGGSVIEGVASESIKAVNGVESSISSVNTTALKDLLEVLKTVVNESSQFTEGQAASKHAILEILESLQAFDGIDVEKLTRVAGSLSSLNSILRTFNSGTVKVTGLTSIAKFVTTISNDLQNPANLSLLSDIKLDGFNDVKASKTLNNLADFIVKVSGSGTIPDLAPLIESLGSISDIKIGRGFNGVASTLSELSKITTGKKFENLQNLKLKDVFDMTGVEGNLTLFKELVSNAQKYADALQLISKYQGTVGKMAAGSSGTSIGRIAREIEAAKAELDKQYTDDAAIRSTTEAMWREYDQARSSVEKLGAAAKDAATPVKELSSSWVGSQSQQVLADIERETDAYMELAAAEQQALEARLAAGEQKEIAAWDRSADKEYAEYTKEAARAFRELERATKAYYDARVAQSKYTGSDEAVVKSLREAVELTERQREAAERKAQAYRDDKAAAEAAASAEVKLASIQATMESRLSNLADRQAAMSGANLVRGSQEQVEALSKVSTAISDLDKKMASMSASRTGKSAGDYRELMRLRAEYDLLREKIENAQITEEQFRTEFAKTSSEIHVHTNAIEMAGEATKSFGDKVMEIAGKLSSWISPMRIVMYVVRTLKQMISTSIELDSAMTQLRIVTNASTESMEKYGEQTAKTAAQIGASIKDLIDSTTVFARLGYSLDESSLLAKYTAMLKQVGDIDIGDAQNAVTAITKAFSEEIKIGDIESVMDRLVQVGNHFPISVSQIATGMNNVSSTLAAAGNSFNESVALLTAANAVVQDVNKASTGLRTVAARLRNTKTELDELGETMETSKYEELVKALTDMHVSLVDINGDYRSTYEIMRDIAAQWGNMSSMQQAALATQIAGVRQQAIFYSIIEQFQEASGAMDAMENSVGSLSNAYDEYLNSVQAHIDQFMAKVQAFGKDMFDSDTMAGVIDFGSRLMDLVSIVGKAINALGGLKVVVAGVASTLAIMNLSRTYKDIRAVNNLVASITEQLIATAEETSGEIVLNGTLKASIASLTAEGKKHLVELLQESAAYKNLDEKKRKEILTNLGVANSIKDVGNAAKDGSVSLKQMWTGMGTMGKLSAVLAVVSIVSTIGQITGLWDAIGKLFKGLDTKIEETGEKIKQLSSEINTISSNFRDLKQQADGIFPRFVELAKGLDALGGQGSLTNEEYEEFLRLNNQLADMFPELNRGMDSNGNAMLALSFNSDTLSESLRLLLERQRELADFELASKFDEQMDLIISQVENYRDKVATIGNEDIVDRRTKAIYDALLKGTTDFYNIQGVSEALDRLGLEYTRFVQEVDGQDEVFLSVNFDEKSKVTAERNYENFLAGIEKETEYYNGLISDQWAGMMPSILALTRQSGAFGSLNKGFQDIALGLVSALDIGELVEEKGYKTEEQIRKYIFDTILDPLNYAEKPVKDAFNNLFDMSDAVRSGEMSAEEYAEKIREIFDEVFNVGDDDSDELVISWLNAIGIKGETVEEVLNSLASAFDMVGKAASGASAGLGSFDEMLKSIKSAADVLAKAEQEMANGGGLSPDTISSLASATEDYLDYLYEENGVIKLNTEAWKEYMVQAAKSRLAALRAEKDRISEDLLVAEGESAAAPSNPEATNRVQELKQELAKVGKEITVTQGTINYYLDQTDDHFKDAISNIKSYYDFLEKAEEEMAAGHGLSADTIKTLMGLTDDYQKYLYEEDGVIKLLIDDWKEFAQGPIRALEESRDALAAQLEGLDEQREAVLRYKEAVGEASEADALANVKKYADAAGMSVDDFIGYVEKLQTDLDKTNNTLNIFNSIFDSIANKSSKLNETQHAIKETVDAAAGLGVLSKLYDDVKNGNAFDFSSLYSDEFVKYFEDCGEAYDNFIDIIRNSPDDIGACQNAFDALASTYIVNSGILDNLTEDSRDYTVALLEQNGVANAAAIVDAQLALQKEILANASADHANNMLAEIANSEALANASESTRVALARSALAKLDINKNTIKTRADIDNLESLARAANATNDVLNRLAKIKELLAKIEVLRQNDYGSGLTGVVGAATAAMQIAAIQAQIQALLHMPLQYGNVSFSGGGAQGGGGSGSSGSSGGGSSGSSGSASSASEKTETWFEKQIKQHQHLVAMDKETLAEYTDWLNTAFQRAYREGIISLDDFNKYEEEVYENRQKIFEEKIEQMQRILEQRAAAGANPNSLVNGWRDILNKLEAEIQRYIDAGYSRSSEVVQNLTDRAAEARDNIISIANEALDGIQNVYRTLHDAADEYNNSGYLSVDTYQSILELGPKYLQYLKNENGELEINEKAIQKVMKLRIKELALDQALMYAQEILNASREKNKNLLYDLTQIQERQTATGWDIVEATLAQARAIGIANGVSADYYDDALSYIRQIRELSEITADTLANSLLEDASESSRGETWFEKQYREHNHLLAMQRETDATYMKWLNQAFRKAYEEGIITEEEFLRYEEEVFNKRQSAFADSINDLKFKISERAALGADPNDLVNQWRTVLGKLQDELKAYLDEGYSINTDVVQNIISQIRDASAEIVSIANGAVDGIQDVYSTLTNAAKEWATTGYLSVDSYQAILELGPKYLSMLMDENGHLQVNEKQLQKVLALRTQELAIDQAMVYAREILAAAERNDTTAMRELTVVNDKQTASTWSLVYATLGMARAIGAANGMQESYFDNAEEYVNRLRQLSITTTTTIAESYQTLNNNYINQADALDEIIGYTKDLLKFENEQHIKAIEDELSAYKKIVDAKKESLRLSKEQDEHDRDLADKVSEIAKLQAKIDQLALDDSREARAQRAALEEQLAEKQKALAESQSDYAYNQQVAALDKEYEAFESEKQDEIDTLQDMYRSEEQLYNAAITRIQNGWENLYEQLIGWNTDYGNVLNNTITAAWNQAAAAVQRYGSFLEALEGVQSHIDLGASSSAKDLVFAKMRENSLQWFSADSAGRKALHAENQALAEQYYNATGSKLQFKNNTWYDEFGMRVYEFTTEEIIRSIVNSMKQNSSAWKSADAATRTYLAKMNEVLAKRIEDLLGQKLTKKSGVWYLPNGKKLFDVYHSGGIAGGAPTLKQNEVLAVLEKGEAILDKKREESLYKIVDFIKVLSDRLGSAINMSAISPAVFNGFRVRPGAVAGELPFNINNASFQTNVSVQIQHSGPYSRDDATKFGKQVADATISKINEAFTKRGVSGIGNAFLKT